MPQTTRKLLKARNFAIKRKDLYTWDDEAPEHVVMGGKSMLSSPVSIVAVLEAPAPMKPLPKAIQPPVSKSQPGKSQASTAVQPRLLPATAIWGSKKVYISRRGQELVEECLAAEKMESRARLPSKGTSGLVSKAEAKHKAADKSLDEKFWRKHRVARRQDRLALEALLAQLERQERDGEGDGGDGDESYEQAPPVARRKPPNPHGLARDKIRRRQRLAAQGRKCFAVDDPVEAEALLPSPEEPKRSPLRRDVKAEDVEMTTEMTTDVPASLAVPNAAPLHSELIVEAAMDDDGRPSARHAHRAKVIAQSLDKKFWRKHQAARREGRRAHQHLLSEMERAERSEADGDLADEDEALELTVARRKPTNPHGLARAKVRRAQRLAARDRKCFAFDDPVEAEALLPSPEEAAPVAKKKKPTPPEDPKLAAHSAIDRMLREYLETAPVLLSFESKGAPLQDLYHGGIMLSCAAVRDLGQMAVGLPVTKQATHEKRNRLKIRERYRSHPKTAHARGAAAALVKPAVLNGQAGRRHS